MTCADVGRPFTYTLRAVPLSILIPAGDDPLAFNIYRFVINSGYEPYKAFAELDEVSTKYGEFSFSAVLGVWRNDDNWDEQRNPVDPKKPELPVNTADHVREENGKNVLYVRISNDRIVRSGAQILSVCVEMAAIVPPNQ